MKFPRQLAAAAATVAVIVGLGLLCAHVAGGGPDPGHALRQPSPRAALVRPERLKTGRLGDRADNGFQLANAGDLIKTGMIEAVLASAVITVSASRRRHRRRRRAAA